MVDIPVDDAAKDNLGGIKEVKEMPAYVTRTVAARQRAGLDVESEPRQDRGVEVHGCPGSDDVVQVFHGSPEVHD